MTIQRFASIAFAILVLPLFAATAQPVRADTVLSAGQIDALVAPIALYPDQLLAKVCIASTYPLEVVEADRWSRRNTALKGSALDDAIASQSWDDSVKTLARTPTVLKMMSDRLDWTQKLGDAFLAQQSGVMDSVQRLRQQAQSSGSLKSTSQQRVAVQNQTIVIESAEPNTIYVPYYNPQVVYGAWAYPAYPPYYWPAPPGYAYGAGVAAGIGFVTGAVVTAAFWNNSFNWHDHNVYANNNININNNFNRNTNINNRTNISGQTWHHDPAHRRGVNYANNDLRQRYGKQTAAGADARRNFRGFDNANGAGNRSGAGNTRPGANGGGIANQSSHRAPSSSTFGQNGRGGGFDGLGSGNSTRQFSSRGQSSLHSGGFSGSHGAMGGSFRGHRR